MLFAVRARIPVVITGAATVAATTLIGLAPLSAKPAAATTSAATPTAWVADSFGSGTLRNAVQPVDLLSPAPAQAPINVTTGPFSSVTTDIVGSKVYVTSQFGTTNTTTGALTIIDASSGAVITQVAVGHGPGPVALSSDGTRAFVANGTTGTNTTTTTGGSLSDVSLSGLNVTATTTVGGDPVALAVSHGSSGDTVWVANAGSSSVTPVSIGATADAAGTPITIAGGTGEPSAIALSPDQSTLYVVDATHANLWAISTSTRAARLVTSLSVINSGQGPINALTVAPDGTVLPYNSNLGAFVPVVVTPTSAVVGSVISVSSLFGFGGWYPTGQISVTPDGSTVYVTYFNAIVQVLWKSSSPVGSAIPAGNAPTSFALTGSFTGFGERIASQMGCALCSVVAGGTQTSQVTALLSDGSQPLAGHTVALAANHSTAVIAPYGTDVTDSTGAVHFLVYDTAPEVDTFSATDQTTGVTILATTQVTFTQVDTMEQSNSTVSAAPTTLLAGNTQTSKITVHLWNGTTNYANRTVALTAQSGSTALIAQYGTNVTDSNGMVQFLVSDANVEVDTLHATDQTDGTPITQTAAVTFTNLAGLEASRSTVVANPTSVPADDSSFSTITVTLTDGTNPIANHHVTLSAPSTSSATVAIVSDQTDSNGVATFRVVDPVAEAVTLSARDDTVPGGVVIVQTATVTFTGTTGGGGGGGGGASCNGVTVSLPTTTVGFVFHGCWVAQPQQLTFGVHGTAMVNGLLLDDTGGGSVLFNAGTGDLTLTGNVVISMAAVTLKNPATGNPIGTVGPFELYQNSATQVYNLYSLITIDLSHASFGGIPLPNLGSLQLARGGTACVTVNVPLPGIIGGVPVSSSFCTSPEGVNVSTFNVTVPKFSLGSIVRLGAFTLSYDWQLGTWQIASLPNVVNGITGNLTFANGRITSGFVQTSNASIAGLVRPPDFSITYDNTNKSVEQWNGTATNADGTQDTIALTFTNSSLTAGHLSIPHASLGGLISVSAFVLDYGNNTWTVSANTNGAVAATLHGSLTVAGGAITAASLSWSHVSAGSLISLPDTSLAYATGSDGNGGDIDTWAGFISSSQDSFSFTADNGQLTSGQIQVTNAGLGNLFTLDSLQLSFMSGQWSVSSNAHAGTATVSGALNVVNGVITQGSIQTSAASIGGLFSLPPFSLTYANSNGAESWSGAVGDPANPQATFAFTDTAGVISTADVAVSKVALANLVSISGVHLHDDGASWSVAGTASSAVGTLGGSLTVVDGSITQGSLTLGSAYLGGLIGVNSVALSYDASQTGEVHWTGSINGGSAAAVDVVFMNGALASGSLFINDATITGAVDIRDVSLSVQPDSQGGQEWAGGATADVAGGFNAAINASLSFDANGNVYAAHLDAQAAVLAGGLSINDFSVNFDRSKDTYGGSLEVTLPGPGSPSVGGGITFTEGRFVSGFVTVSTDLPLGGGLTLKSGTLTVSVDPVLKLSGSMTVAAGPVLTLPDLGQVDAIDGTGTLTYTGGNPQTWDISTSIDIGGHIQVASGELKMQTDGTFAGTSVTFTADFGYTYPGGGILPAVGVQANINGWASDQGFGANANVQGRLGTLKGTVGLGVSNLGFGVCMETIPNVYLGVDVPWGQAPHLGCDYAGLGTLAAARTVTSGPALLTAAPTAHTFSIPAGQPSALFVVSGSGGVSSVDVTAPNGTVWHVPSSTPSGLLTSSVFVLQDPANNLTDIVVGSPAPGTWTVSPEKGSVPIASVYQTNGLARPAITATVTPDTSVPGTFDLTEGVSPVQPGQSVQFLEEGTGFSPHLVGVSTASGGVMRFTPADGPGGTRTVVAEVDENGLPRYTQTVTTYTAPSPTVPAAPRSVTAVAESGGLALVSWQPPASDGGSGITAYVVTPSGGGAPVWVRPGTTSTAVTVAHTGSEHFSVAAVNGIGTGAAAASPAISVTAANGAPAGATVPGAPLAVSATAHDGSVTVAWAPPANGGSAITGYAVVGSPGNLVVPAAATARSATVSGLADGTSYSFSVVALNAVGASLPGGPAAATPAGVPSAPQNLQASGAVGQVTLAWTGPARDNGSTVTGYAVLRSASAGGPFVPLGMTTAAGYVDTAIPPTATVLWYEVKAENGAGWSSAAGPVSATLVFPWMGDGTCAGGMLPVGTYHNVTARAGCVLDAADHITGDVHVVQGGSLWDQGSAIAGDLRADHAAWVAIAGGRVGGSLQLAHTTGVPPSTVSVSSPAMDYVCGTTVAGDVQVTDSGPAAPFEVGGGPDCSAGLTVGGNLDVHNNGALLIVGGAANPTVAGAGTIVGHDIDVHDNRGGGRLTDSSAGHDCRLHDDSPAIVGSANTAAHTSTCDGTG